LRGVFPNKIVLFA